MKNYYDDDTIEALINNASLEVQDKAKKLGLKYGSKEIKAICKQVAYDASNMSSIYEKTVRAGLSKLLNPNREEK